MRQRPYNVGSRVVVHNVPSGYPLPVGLPEDAWVRVVAIDIGYCDVGFSGQVFRVAQPCIDSGFWVRHPDGLKAFPLRAGLAVKLFGGFNSRFGSVAVWGRLLVLAMLPKWANPMTTIKKSAIALCLAALCHPAATLGADFRAAISYQGRLLHENNPLHGQTEIEFRFFTAQTNGECVFAEFQKADVKDGLIDTFIGKNPTMGAIEETTKFDEVFLEVVVNRVPLVPRQRYVPPPFARRSTRKWNMVYSSVDWIGCATPDLVARFQGSTEISDHYAPIWLLYSVPPECNPLAYFLPTSEKVVITVARFMVVDTGNFPRNSTNLVGLRLVAGNLKNDPTGNLRQIGAVQRLDLDVIPPFEWQNFPLPADSSDRILFPSDILAFQIVPEFPLALDFIWRNSKFMLEVEVR